jgi:pyruvate/2-oxoglutarate/acetoin dehydrogenase E1 component
MRVISYSNAINETFRQMMQADPRVFLIGQGVTSPWYVGSTTHGLLDDFGPERVIDTPVSENAITGAAVGAALAGMRPVVVHPRLDFMYYAFDPIANHAAPWYYMFGGQHSVPLTIWGIINRGGEQAAQHSQAIQAFFAHLPGLKVVMPSTPYDAKGLLVSAIRDPNPVVFIDDRWLYAFQGEVPETLYEIPIGKGIVKMSGDDVTLIATSYMVHEALKAAETVKREGISVEVIDPRSLKPFDDKLLFSSVEKTRRLIIADGGWKTYGIAAEMAALVAETGIVSTLKSPVLRVTLPDMPAPASAPLELKYYKREPELISAIRKIMRK